MSPPRSDATTPPDPRQRIASWVDRWGASLLAVARAHAPSEDEAQEAVAESWQVVLTKAGSLPPDPRAHGWLIGIVRNVARARRRRETRRRELEREYAPDIAATDADVQVPVEASLVIPRVWRAIADLPELQREVVVARVLDGMSTKAVAQAIERTEGTVKTSLHRALRRLREEFGSTLEEALASATTTTRETKAP